MVHKRKRNTSVPLKALSPDVPLKRNGLANPHSLCSQWGWVGTEVTDATDITLEHRMATCGLSQRNNNAYCANKYAAPDSDVEEISNTTNVPTTNGELEDDIIIISDNDETSCTKKDCKSNPNCLNYLGQNKWTDEESASENYIKAANLGPDPSRNSRKRNLPVGLKNLGATCYANASLQVWYRDLAFREGVYHCKPPDSMPLEKYKESPIFQLQVTFAALQSGNKRVFNPTKLVESLQLRTYEQQDAQEFSKLFISHLDNEFKKQTLPSVKSLVTDQFQGGSVYGTICHACGYRSERNSDFLEIEISFESNNSKLQDRIAASLLPETLSGENQYFCSKCEQLQDATRYTELRKLPPVLHFSLMRFVYDLTTMERKKSKHSISFPTHLNMDQFLGSPEDRENSSATDLVDSYELRGVLLHKGTSAYHGHYEAQVKDAEHGSWFLFNDEMVTTIKSLAPTTTPIEIEDDDEKSSSQVKKNRANVRKRRRVDDSDDEIIETKRKASVKPSPKLSPVERGSTISSKDAYMLIYAKKDLFTSSNTSNTPHPPPPVMEFIENMNQKHIKLCQVYQANVAESEARFQDIRRRVMDIFQSWNCSPTASSLIVSRQSLEAWLSKYSIDHSLAIETSESSGNGSRSPSPSQPPQISISISDVTCEHNLLDPTKLKDMKRISQAGHDLIRDKTDCIFEPLLEPSDVCVECTSTLFREKLYEVEHPRYTKRFDDAPRVQEEDLGYWVSKRWCRDWRLLKPRMHSVSEDDPGPESGDFYDHVYCEHGGLSFNATNRRKISREAMEVIKELFPSWNPPSSETEICAICDAEVHISKEDKKELRRRIEDEKARLRFMLEISLDAWTETTEPVLCATIPTQFIKQWKRWLNNPCDNARPEEIDNGSFLCEHGLLVFDPNCPTDLDSTVKIVQRSDWNALESLYTCGPLIALTRRALEDGSVFYDHEILICEECRVKRNIDWESADIVVRLCTSKQGPKPASQHQRPIIAYSRVNGARQSKRLRQVKEHGERRKITVSKTTTLKDIRIMVQEEFNIPTICQRLFHRGKELEDNSSTVAVLQLVANDVIDLKEVEEIVEIDSDSEARPPKKRREGPAFDGTLLGGRDSSWTSSPEQTPIPPSSLSEKTCTKCTFSNGPDVIRCEMCDTPFE